MIVQRIKTLLKNFNLFKDPNLVTNRYLLRNQIISTRIFLLLFAILIFVVIIYLLADKFTQVVTIENPTLSQYKKLKIKYEDVLQCSCSNSSIPYETFISLQARMHEVCSLDFDPLIDTLFEFTETLTNNHDFRFTAALVFRLLTLLCSSVNQTLEAQLVSFNKTLLNSVFLLDEMLLKNQAIGISNQFIYSTTNQFVNLLQMIRINYFGSQVKLSIS